MKRLLGLLMICSLALGMFTACGKKEDSQGENNSGKGGTTNTQQSASTDLVETGGTKTYTVDASVVSGMSKVDTGSLYVTESMIDKGISRAGSLDRLAEAMEKAAAGGTVTIAYIGGSITAGEGASSYDKSYAALTTAWWKATFPNATIKEVNIGAINSDSYVSVHRIADEVISQNPDVVIIDTAVDDNGAISEEAFESMVRVLLSAGSTPAVIPLITTNSTYVDDGVSQSALAFKLNLAVISYADVLENNITNGTWSWADVSTTGETVNPSDSGHAFIAYLLTGYFGRVLSGIADSQYNEYVLTESTSTKARYTKSSIISPELVPHDGEDNALTDLPGADGSFITKGMCTLSGKEATFEVTGKNIGVLYWKSIEGQSGKFDVYIDDATEPVTTLDGDLSGVEGATYNYIEYYELAKFDESGTHTIRFVMNTEEESAGDDFYVCGFTVSE